MDKIFKNDTIMGVVTITTLVLVGYLAYQKHKEKSADSSLLAVTE